MEHIAEITKTVEHFNVVINDGTVYGARVNRTRPVYEYVCLSCGLTDTTSKFSWARAIAREDHPEVGVTFTSRGAKK